MIVTSKGMRSTCLLVEIHNKPIQVLYFPWTGCIVTTGKYHQPFLCFSAQPQLFQGNIISLDHISPDCKIIHTGLIVNYHPQQSLDMLARNLSFVFLCFTFFPHWMLFLFAYLVRSLHWLIPGFFYALFIQWSIFATIKESSPLSAQSRILQP